MFLTLALANPSDAQDVAGGTWNGAASKQNTRLPIQLTFERTAQGLAGRITIPSMGALDIPLKNVSDNEGSVRFDIPTDDATFMFNGSVRGDTLTGSWNLLGMESQVAVTRTRGEPLPYRSEDIRCQNGSVTLAGTLNVPASQSNRVPAVVFVHGSGAATRDGFNFWADQFSRMGVAALTFDKRGTGRSTGDWRSADFNDLAHDVLACVDRLKAHSGIDAARIGLFGQSQGGWVAPLAASLSPDVAWLVLVSGPSVTPAEQNWWEAESTLRALHVPQADLDRASTLWQQNDRVTRTGEGFPDLESEVRRAGTRWLAPIGLQPLPAADAPERLFLRRILDYDPLPALHAVAAPSLWIFGARDATVPTARCASVLESLKAEHKDVTVRMFPNATHALWTAPAVQSFQWPGLAPGYVDAVKEWVSSRIRPSR